MPKPVKKIKNTNVETALIKEKEKKRFLLSDDVAEPFENAKDSLMPELEELVKKNPNRLIGCGG